MSERGESLMEAMGNYLPGGELERRERLVRLMGEVLDEKAKEYLRRKYQGMSWKVLIPLMGEIESGGREKALAAEEEVARGIELSKSGRKGRVKNG